MGYPTISAILSVLYFLLLISSSVAAPSAIKAISFKKFAFGIPSTDLYLQGCYNDDRSGDLPKSVRDALVKIYQRMEQHIENEGDGPLEVTDDPITQSIPFRPGVQQAYRLIIESYGVSRLRLTYGDVRDLVGLYGIGYLLRNVIGYHDFQAEITRVGTGKRLGMVYTEWLPSFAHVERVGDGNSTLGMAARWKQTEVSTS
ncbi:MAG: hypothetical protein Q9174_004930 [Haloplaca sp. 1 TL-2023]